MVVIEEKDPCVPLGGQEAGGRSLAVAPSMAKSWGMGLGSEMSPQIQANCSQWLLILTGQTSLAHFSVNEL